jgi:hypothetical protein
MDVIGMEAADKVKEFCEGVRYEMPENEPPVSVITLSGVPGWWLEGKARKEMDNG